MSAGTEKNTSLIKYLYRVLFERIRRCPIVCTGCVVVSVGRGFWGFFCGVISRGFFCCRRGCGGISSWTELDVVLEFFDLVVGDHILAEELTFVCMARSIDTFVGVVAIEGMNACRDKLGLVGKLSGKITQ